MILNIKFSTQEDATEYMVKFLELKSIEELISKFLNKIFLYARITNGDYYWEWR